MDIIEYNGETDEYKVENRRTRVIINPKNPEVIRVEKKFLFWWTFCFSFINPYTKKELNSVDITTSDKI
jgi:hypothetical protein